MSEIMCGHIRRFSVRTRGSALKNGDRALSPSKQGATDPQLFTGVFWVMCDHQNKNGSVPYRPAQSSGSLSHFFTRLMPHDCFKCTVREFFWIFAHFTHPILIVG